MIVGYIRVSTDKQDISLDAQRQKIEAMAVVRGITVDEIIVDDGESAKNLDRPGMQRLLKLVNSRQADEVIIAKLDRLTRSVRDMGDIIDLLNRKGVALVSVAEVIDSSSAAGRLMMNILATVAQWERETISERTKEALQSKRRRGAVAGNIPYGYKRTGSMLEEDPDEMRVVDLIDQWSKELTLRQIADRLNQQDYRTRSGALWQHQYVANVLKGMTK